MLDWECRSHLALPSYIGLWELVGRPGLPNTGEMLARTLEEDPRGVAASKRRKAS
ncbi:hypothetical protein P7K49_009700, partial [Saguinus oedipus]